MSQRALDRAIQRLARTSPTPRLDAELLLAAALGIGRDKLILDPPHGKPPAVFEAMVERRAAGEPIAYITGHRAFWTIDLEVGPGVLVPRPDSETLIEAAVEHFRERAGPSRILDLGTGPGTLLLAALDEWPEARGLGIDNSLVALDYARRNAERIGLSARAGWQPGDWAEGLDERFDLILCNPPYVAKADPELAPDVAKYEPPEALFAEDGGLAQYRRLVPQLLPLLKKGGLAALEIGHRQAAQVMEIVAHQGVEPRLRRDLGDRPRVVLFDG